MYGSQLCAGPLHPWQLPGGTCSSSAKKGPSRRHCGGGRGAVARPGLGSREGRERSGRNVPGGPQQAGTRCAGCIAQYGRAAQSPRPLRPRLTQPGGSGKRRGSAAAGPELPAAALDLLRGSAPMNGRRCSTWEEPHVVQGWARGEGGLMGAQES